MKGKVVLAGIIIVMLMIIIKFSTYALSGITYNAILPIFQMIDQSIEYVIDICFSVVGFLVITVTFVVKPQKVKVKWEDKQGRTRSKSTNKYFIGVLVGLLLIYFPPITQIIMIGNYFADNSYWFLFIFAIIEGLGWIIAGYGLGVKIIHKCYNCHENIPRGSEIKCKTCNNTFCSEECYDEHMLYTHDKCAICGRGFGRGANYETCPNKECKNLKFCSKNCLKEHKKLKHK
ncbi:MAG: hypothetical protein GF329_03340 [Candidatus Lokiarchaeota archaeon]|nr:hypothetical protein [Candidatus Lokiarchaeota archaeon]